MNEAQTAQLITSLASTLPSLLALYKQIVANRSGVKSYTDILADADATYDANLAQLNSED